jgi:DNA-binding transcriptional LysR family regulator
MNLRQLEVFRAVVQTGTTKGAAHILNISQPAVSTMIQHTEDQLGLPLFERVRGRLVPTEEALSLFAESSSIFSLFDSLQKKVEDLRHNRGGSIRITATPSLANSILPLAIHRFSVKRPDVRISVDIRDRETVFHHVARSVAEIGLLLEFQDHPSLGCTPIHQSRFVCAVRRDHELASKKSIHLSDLRNVSVVRLERGSVLGNLIDNKFSDLGEQPKWTVETRYCQTACALVQAGAAAAIVDAYVTLGPTYPDVVIRPLKPNIPVRSYIIYANDRPLSRLAKLLISELRETELDME